MGGCAVADDCEVNVRTLVLLGRTGNGKSATGNSILGKKEFKSKSNSNGVTTTCELKSTRLHDGPMIHVIDTPGLFDFSGEPEYIGKEIVKCMELAMYGIHAVLLVLSVRARFTREEQAAVQCFQEFFGQKIRNYMVVIFTGGDDLEDDGESLDDYLGNDCPEPLKETIMMCDNRVVLFDNKTKDSKKIINERNKLLSLVTLVLEKNGSVPYTKELFNEMKAFKAKSLVSDLNHVANELNEPVPKSYEEHFKQLTENVILKMMDITHKYLELWATERAHRLVAEKTAQAISENEIRELREKLQRLELKPEQQAKGGCYIL